MQVSVISSDKTVCLHLAVASFVTQSKHMTFLKKLRNESNPSLWSSFECDGDGKWVYDELVHDTLIMMINGLYNKTIADDICLAGFVIKCSHSIQIAYGSWVKKSD